MKTVIVFNMAAFTTRPRGISRRRPVQEGVPAEHWLGAVGLLAFPTAGLLCAFGAIAPSAFLLVAAFALALYGLALVK